MVDPTLHKRFPGQDEVDDRQVVHGSLQLHQGALVRAEQSRLQDSAERLSEFIDICVKLYVNLTRDKGWLIPKETARETR